MQLQSRLLAVVLSALANPPPAQDVSSGPDKNAKVPALKVFDATGVNKDKDVDYAAERKDKPTIYLLVRADKFDRPMNRFMKGLDAEVKMESENAYIVAVWLTDDVDKAKERLPAVQQSVQYEHTALTIFTGGKDGPKDWNANSDAHLTVVLANKGKVAATFGYQSVNETDVKAVRAAFKKSLK
jgi:hypothetical protein